MSTSALLRGLVDDAAVFPPGSSPIAVAVGDHRRHRAAPYAACVGPLLVRAPDAAAAAALLDPGERLPIALVVRPGSDPLVLPTAVEQLQRDERSVVVGLELPVSDPLSLRPVTDLRIPVWLEVSAQSLDQDLDAVAAIGTHAKLRTGGLSADDFPTEEQLARFVLAAQARALRFKLTAGLHHAVRNTDPEQGFEQHGVANVLAATWVAQADGGLDRVVEVLAERDPAVLRRLLGGLDDDAVARLRASFASFGCCGVTEPITELAALGFDTGFDTGPDTGLDTGLDAKGTP
jgi:hypothetical protein